MSDLKIEPLDVYRRPGEPGPELRAPETLEEWRDAWSKEYSRVREIEKKVEALQGKLESSAIWQRFYTLALIISIGGIAMLVMALWR